MKAAGVNMIRTGIWTGWKKYMTEPGKLNEATLRAFDAFLLTAHKHDIPVIFNFFASCRKRGAARMLISIRARSKRNSNSSPLSQNAAVTSTTLSGISSTSRPSAHPSFFGIAGRITTPTKKLRGPRGSRNVIRFQPRMNCGATCN
jgi:hypothetical protein